MRWLRSITVLGVLSVILPLLISVPASAAPTWTPPELLGVGGEDVRMDVGASGDAAVAWTSSKGVTAAFRPAGEDWQRPVVLKRAERGVIDVLVDRRGVARVVWWNDEQIGVATRGRDGKWRLDPGAPSAGGCCWTSTPTAAGDDEGNMVVAWTETDDLDPGQDETFYWRTPGGRWTPVGGGTNPYRSGIVVRAGFATVVDVNQASLREATASLNGDLRTTQVLRSEGDFGAPELATNHRGDMVVAVLDGTEDSDGVMQSFDPGELVLLTRSAGSEWGTVVDGGGKQVSSPAVAVNDAGDFVVAYRRVADGAVVVRSGNVGRSLGPEQLVGSDAHTGEISVALGPDGVAAVTWVAGDGDAGAVYAATKPVGSGWSEPVRLGEREHSGSPYENRPSLVAYPNGMFTALLHDGTAVRWADHVDDTTAPNTRMAAPRRDYVRGTKIRVAWNATDELSRPDSHDVRYRVAGRAGSFRGWQRWLTGTERLNKVFLGRPGRTYCFAARSHDRVGNTGPWSTQQCIATALDDRALSIRTRDWERVRNRRAYSDTLTVTKSRAQVLRLDDVRASAIRILVRTCRSCGEFVVEHGGKRIGVVNTAAPRARNRLILVHTYDRARNGPLVIRTTGARPVRIDGIIASR